MANSRYDRDREGGGARSRERDERGFFERAGDELSGWFRDDDSRRGRDDDRSDREYRRPMMDSDDDRYGRGSGLRDDGRRQAYSGRPEQPPYGERFGPERAFHEDRFDRGSSQREPRWSEPRQRDLGQRDRGVSSGAHDPHYAEWRNRQISQLDRDYDEYRRENQSRFESDFSNWRNTRQAKRQLLGSIRPNMQVVGADDQLVGTVDKVRGDRLILASDGGEDGEHRSISCGMIERVEGDRVMLEKNADEAKRTLGSEIRDRALFERDDDGETGAHILNRSFGGTY